MPPTMRLVPAVAGARWLLAGYAVWTVLWLVTLVPMLTDSAPRFSQLAPMMHATLWLQVVASGLNLIGLIRMHVAARHWAGGARLAWYSALACHAALALSLVAGLGQPLGSPGGLFAVQSFTLLVAPPLAVLCTWIRWRWFSVVGAVGVLALTAAVRLEHWLEQSGIDLVPNTQPLGLQLAILSLVQAAALALVCWMLLPLTFRVPLAGASAGPQTPPRS